MAVSAQTIEQVRSATEKYKYGFVTDIDLEFAPKGLNEDIIRFISAKKQEPEWLLEWRLKAYRHWLTMRSEEHTSELQSLMRISYAVFCLKKKNTKRHKK